ncbi:hypothetical protein [Zhongshania arctica]|uniref:Uncharacterized protein n=1 Tax=Zhongshania arctica TaxID=3238302 RepID=A0ABV3TSC3_9GAMM
MMELRAKMIRGSNNVLLLKFFPLPILGLVTQKYPLKNFNRTLRLAFYLHREFAMKMNYFVFGTNNKEKAIAFYDEFLMGVD